MAFETGTASNYLDLLDKLSLFMTGNNSPASGLNWVEERNITTSPEEREIIWRGTGGVSPESNLYFGVKTYSDDGVGRHNWDLRGMTGFIDGSPEGSVTFETQPGISPANTYVPLENASMTYWFYGNDRRVMMVAKTGTSYQFMHAGFINTFATEVEYPYPLCIIGSTWDVDQRFGDNSVDYQTIPIPSSDIGSADEGPVFIRFVDGVWYGFQNVSGTSTQSSHALGRHIWPMAPDFIAAELDPNSLLPSRSVFLISNAPLTFFEQFFDSSVGGTPNERLLRSFGSPQPSPIFPLTLIMQTPSTQYLGELDNLFWISATGGLTAEDFLLDTSVSPEEQYDIFQNIHRTDDWSFFAIKRE
jgi:hypothetical protein